MNPSTLEELDSCLKDPFVILDGPSQASIVLGQQSHRYVTFAFTGENASNKELVEALWEELKKHLPAKKEALFWRTRPAIDEVEQQVFFKYTPTITREMVQDGAEIPPEYVLDFESNAYRQLDCVRLMRRIYCRVWWPGLPKDAGKREGEPCSEIVKAGA